MPSPSGLRTWLEYEWLFLKVALALAALGWGGGLLLGFLRDLALPSTEFAPYVVGFCLFGVVLTIWLAGR